MTPAARHEQAMTGHRIAEARLAAALAQPRCSRECVRFSGVGPLPESVAGESLSKKESLSEMLRAAAACLGLRLARPADITNEVIES